MMFAPKIVLTGTVFFVKQRSFCQLRSNISKLRVFSPYVLDFFSISLSYTMNQSGMMLCHLSRLLMLLDISDCIIGYLQIDVNTWSILYIFKNTSLAFTLQTTKDI